MVGAAPVGYNGFGEGELSLLFNVAQLLKEPPGFSRSVDIKGEALVSGGEGLTRVKGSALLTHTDQGVWVEGRLNATLETECSRCLASFCQWVTLRLSDLYIATVDLQTGRKVPVPEGEDDYFLIDGHHMLDLTEGVRQYAIGAAPLQPLCSDHCRGICPQCGANLNEGLCGCEPPIDPRWEPLMELLNASPSPMRRVT